jgi:hypothetical protein
LLALSLTCAQVRIIVICIYLVLVVVMLAVVVDFFVVGCDSGDVPLEIFHRESNTRNARRDDHDVHPRLSAHVLTQTIHCSSAARPPSARR